MRVAWFLCIAMLALVGCEGDLGPAGPAGEDGADGADWPGPPPQAYLDADGIAGGAAYSKWWTTEAAGSGTEPSTGASADFYRCKACHAWDGLGNAGSYADRTGQSSGNSNRPDVSTVNLRSTSASESYSELFDLVMHVGGRNIDAMDNTHPGYSTNLGDEQAWNLVKFMREEWITPDLLYDLEVSGPVMYWDYSVEPPVLVKPTLTYSNVGALGDETNGQALVASLCTSCHGNDGTGIAIGSRSLGQFIREKPHEAWFKVKFGEPGTGMEPGLATDTGDLQDIYAALANATNYPDL